MSPGEALPQDPSPAPESHGSDEYFPELPPNARRSEEELRLSSETLSISQSDLHAQSGAVNRQESGTGTLTSGLDPAGSRLNADQERAIAARDPLAHQNDGAQKAAADLAGGKGKLSPPAVTIEENAQEIRIGISADVLFDFNKWGIRPDAVPVLQKVLATIRAHGKLPLELEGHTDSVGSDDYNDDLSQKRAKSVAAWLVHRGGVAPARITTRGFGEARPVAPNTKPDGSDNPDGRQKNRRVELRLKKQ